MAKTRKVKVPPSSSNGSRTRSSLPPLPTKRTGKENRQSSNPPRYRPHTRAFNEVIQLQNSTEQCIPYALFKKTVREIGEYKAGCDDLRYEKTALMALWEASEHFVIGLLEDSYLITLHSKRVTLSVNDLRLAYRIRGDSLRYGYGDEV